MALVDSATAKGDKVTPLSPTGEVTEATAAPALERVEVRPGVLIKMNAADKKAWQEREAAAAADREAYLAKTRQPVPAERTTVEAPERAVSSATRKKG